jgi:hypothetical protein
MCVYYSSTYYKAVCVCVCVCLLLQYLFQCCSRGGEGDSEGHVLRETTSRGLCGLVCPSRTRGRGRLRERRRGRGSGAREGACTGTATMTQPSTLRLIRNTAALAAASPTWIFSGWWNAACLKRNDSDWLRCDDIPAAVKCASVSWWACRKRRRKTRHACGWMCS